MPHANEGACLCGAVRFAIEGPYRWFAHCHCSMCRKQSGALFGTSLGVAEPRFRWLAGERAVTRYRATPAFERPFCSSCGGKTPARSHEADSWTVPAGLVRGELGSRPRSHIFVAAKSPWVDIADGLPQHAAFPPGIALPIVPTEAGGARQQGLEGCCLCGAVAFEANERPREIVHSHRTEDRSSSGAAYASRVTVTASSFRWRRGEELVRRYATDASRPYRTAFCQRCGSAAPQPSDDASTVELPAGGIDTILPALPAVHIHAETSVSWLAIADRAARP